MRSGESRGYPVDGKSLRAAGLAELLRIIREQEAPTPSAKITGLGDTALEIARRRSTDPNSLRRQLAGDLNWIVMKALEKDRRRRYSSVSELATDVRRHLEDQPVLAGPPSGLYRARKFVRRHKLGVMAGLVIAASLIAGLATTAWQASVARRERTAAIAQKALAEQRRREATAAQATAETERNRADEHRRQAEELFAGVRGLAHSMLFDIEDQIAELGGATPAREALVRKSMEYLDRLSTSPLADPEMRRELGAAYLKVGDLQGRPGYPNLDDRVAARQSYAKSIAFLDPLSAASPKDAALLHLLCEAHSRRGVVQASQQGAAVDMARARSLAEAELAMAPRSSVARTDVALVLIASDVAKVLPAADRERALFRAKDLTLELLKEHPSALENRRNAVFAYRQLGWYFYGQYNNGRALEWDQQEIKDLAALTHDFPANVQLRDAEAYALRDVSLVYLQLGRNAEAQDSAQRAVAIQQSLADSDPRNAGYRLDLTGFQRHLALVLLQAGHRQEALDTAMKALAGLERLAAELSRNPQVQWQIADTQRFIAQWAANAVDHGMEAEYYRKAEATLEQLVRRSNLPEYRRALADARIRLGTALRYDFDLTGSLAKIRQGVAEQERLAQGQPSGDESWGYVADGYLQLGAAMRAAKDPAGAIAILRKALPLYGGILAAHPERTDYRPKIAEVQYALADSYSDQQNWKAVLDVLDQAQPVFEAEYKAHPDPQQSVDDLANTLMLLARALGAQRQSARAIDLLRRAVAVRASSAAREPTLVVRAYYHVMALRDLTDRLRLTGNRDAALAGLEEGRAVLDRYQSDALNLHQQRMLAFGYLALAQGFLAAEENASAEEASAKVIPVFERLHDRDPKDERTRLELATLHGDAALAMMRTGHHLEALAHQRRNLELWKLRTHDAVPDWTSVVLSQNRIAVLCGRIDDRACVEQSLHEVIALARQGYAVASGKWASSSQDLPALQGMISLEERIMAAWSLLGNQHEALTVARSRVAHAALLARQNKTSQNVLDDARAEAARLVSLGGGSDDDFADFIDRSTAVPDPIRYATVDGWWRWGEQIGLDGWLESRAAFSKALELVQPLLAAAPANLLYRRARARCLRSIGQRYFAEARIGIDSRASAQKAMDYFQQARTAYLELAAERPLVIVANTPDQITTQIANCQALLAALRD